MKILLFAFGGVAVLLLGLSALYRYIAKIWKEVDEPFMNDY